MGRPLSRSFLLHSLGLLFTVSIRVGFQFLMLTRLLAGWRWEFAGAVVTLTTAVPFFAATAGRNFPWFTLVTVIPSALWLYCVWQERKWRRPHSG